MVVRGGQGSRCQRAQEAGPPVVGGAREAAAAAEVDAGERARAGEFGGRGRRGSAGGGDTS